MITISIADDHQLFRQGITSLLGTIANVQVMHETETGTELMERLRKEVCDIILLDINMPELDGIECAKLIKKDFPSIKILILSMHADHETIENAVKAGIDGYLPKNTGKDELDHAIQTVQRGEKYFNAEITATIMNGLVSNKIIQPVRLTPREKEVLQLICEEYTTQDIADQLFISFNTVETHRKNLLHKTGSKNSLGLFKFALDNKLFQLDK